MVGPTAEELESIKELIRFDHVYYKKSSTDTSVVDSFENNVSVFTSTDEPIPMISEDALDQDLTKQNILTSETMDIPVDNLSEIAVNQDSAENSKDYIFPVCSPVCHTDILESMKTKMSPSRSDSGYDSALSLCSPLSDVDSSGFGNLLDESSWEDPFSELFPSLI